ncbi:type IV secretion system DNA-binding domain-containing protein [Ramlibacter sp. RBP-2]|uniref:Type IV secretion system DNA-binding domain-containing protein n=1 Tax=Ramlibacter lithotrophicus TaxID=2606681 RepID=A0A7X6I6W9_9BURK|nr:type IV secretion system DNA-binding domain-containing protein [Ramlibacter lithotrophicus]NKE66848.1 type IV secretion system DNA-binding domain-containing protein [Ramlibacter lithotrophicus]
MLLAFQAHVTLSVEDGRDATVGDMDPEKETVSYVGETAGRLPHKVFGIRQADRAFHMHIIGKTGTGKTTLLENLLRQDIDAGRGLTLIDPHGDLAERISGYAKASGRSDLIYLDAADPEAPYGYNPLKRIADHYIPLAVSGLLETFKKRFADAWGVRMEHVLRNALYAVLDTGGGTLPDILKLLADKDHRKDLAKRIRNETVREFWQKEFPNYSDRYRVESLAPIQNKLGAFLADPRVRRLLTEAPQELSFRRIMDQGGVLIVNLARGKLGEDSSSLLGALFVTSVALAAYSRASMPEAKRLTHYLYADEFQSFTTTAVADMISELRKYGLRLVVAHQHFDQLEDAVKHAILGNAGTLIRFRVGAEDAKLISREFAGLVPAEDLVTLPNYTVYLRLMIDGEPSTAFRARTLSPQPS